MSRNAASRPGKGGSQCSRESTSNLLVASDGTRAAIYCRVSTGRQAERGLSLAAQRTRCAEEVDRRGWTMAREFVERGVSGKLASRPQLDALVAAAEAGELDYVIVPKLDRLGRSVRNLYELHERLTAAGVQLVCLDPAIDASTPMGRAMLGMLAVLAELEREQIAERVTAVQGERRAQGLHTGQPAFGYSSEQGRWSEHPEEAEIVRRIFREHLAGVPQLQIAQRLRGEGVPTRRGKWEQGTVSKVLHNPVYVGLPQAPAKGREPSKLGDAPCGCGHPALVDAETFGQAASLLGGRHRKGGPNRRTAGGHLFLGGYLRCGYCGGPLSPRTDRGRRGGAYETYLCLEGRRTGKPCKMPPVRRDLLEGGIVEHFTRAHLDARAMMDRHRDTMDARLREARASFARAERAAEQASGRLDRVRGHYQDGRLDPEDWAEQRAQLTADRDAAVAAVERLADEVEAAHVALHDDRTEDDVLAFLGRLQSTVLAPVRGAETMDALRAGFRRVWPHGFTVFPPGHSLLPEGADLVLLARDEHGNFRAPAAVDRIALDVPGLHDDGNSYEHALQT